MTLLEAVRPVIVRHVSGISVFGVPGKLGETLIADDLIKQEKLAEGP